MTRQEAIDAKCKECIYDPEEDGTWRQQVKACAINTCALHPYRPMPYKVRNQPVEREYKTIEVKAMGDTRVALCAQDHAVGGDT